MSYKLEKDGDLIIAGFEKGIATSPHQGIGDLKALNVTTMQGEVSVNYARIQQTQTSISGGTFSASLSNQVTYIGATPLLVGSWITISASTITNLDTTSGFSSGPNYYVLSYDAPSGHTTLASSYSGSVINNFGLTGTATFSTLVVGKPIDYAYTSIASFPNFEYFILDANGIVWYQPSGNTNWAALQPTAAHANTTGVFCYGEYIFVAADKLYYKSLSAFATGWTSFKTLNQSGSNIPHHSVTTPSNLLVLCDGSQLDTLATVSGQTFDPTNAATYTWTSQALLLPNSDVATQIALIGGGAAATGGVGSSTTVLVGGLTQVVYPWTPGNSFFGGVIFLPEDYTQQIVTVNNLAYIFAGSKGNIYITNGTSVTSVISVPDYIANNVGTNQDPYFIWGGAMYLRGRMWFSVQAPNCGGVWSFVPTINYFVEQDTGITLRLEHQNSYGSYAGVATVLFAPQRTTDANTEGVQYYSGWDNGSSVYGIDYSDTIPFTNGAAIIETDAIPTGNFVYKKTFKQIEYKLSAPLTSITTTAAIPAGATSATLSSTWNHTSGAYPVTFSDGQTKNVTFTDSSTAISWSGGLTGASTSTLLLENIAINYRLNLTDSWQSCGNVILEPLTPYSGYFTVDFQNTQWLQLQIILTPTAFSPSFCRLREIRVR